MRRQLLLAVAGVVLAGALPAGAGEQPPCQLRVVDGWTLLPAPDFGVGRRRVHDFAASVASADHLVVTNGQAIAVSVDGGCSWKVTYRVQHSPDDPGRGPGATEIASVHMPEFAGSQDVVYAATTTAFPAAEVPSPPVSRIVRSTDAGFSWTELGDAIGSTSIEGSVTDVVSAPSDTRRMYAVTAPARYDGTRPDTGTAAETAAAVWRSEDSGESWTRAAGLPLPSQVATPIGTVAITDPSTETPLRGRDRLAVRPGMPDQVWLFGAKGLLVSDDGGRVFEGEEAVSFGRAVADVEFASADRTRGWIAIAGAGPVLAEAGEPIFGNRQYRRLPPMGLAGRLTSMALGTDDDVFLATDSATYYYRAGMTRAVPMPLPGRTLTEVERVPGEGPMTVVGNVGTGLARRVVKTHHDSHETEVRPPRPPKGLDPIELEAIRAATAGSALLHPSRIARRLSDGGTADQRYRLSLPRRRAVDVFFLIDVSGSMEEEIDGLRRGLADIVRTVAAADVDAHFGLGIYRSYDFQPAYERIRDIGPVDRSLADALNALGAGNGSQETALAALGQIPTGHGQSDRCVDPITGAGYDAYIAPGQQVGFRDGALPVVLHITDEGIADTPCQPTIAQVGAALGAKRIRHVGLGFESLEGVPWHRVLPGEPPVSPRAGLTALSQLTDAYAVTPVDCDADGVADIGRGKPLVCMLPSDDAELSRLMAAAISSALLAIRDVGTVTLEAVTSRDMVHHVVPARVPAVDLTAAQTLHFDVSFVCAEGDDAKHPVVLVASARGVPIATADAVIACTTTPAATPVGRLPRVGGIPPVPHPLAEPIPSVHSQAQAQSQPQSQSQSQGQGANQGALAEEERSQVGLATSQQETQGGEELAMTGRTYEDVVPLAAQWLAAATFAGTAVAVRRRTQRASAAAVARARR